MPKGRQVSVQVTGLVNYLARQGYGAAQIERELHRQKYGLKPLEIPEIRTLQRMVRKAAPLDESGPWSFAEASEHDPDKARLVLDVVVAIFRASEGRVWLTNALADWVARIRTVSPTVWPGMAYALAFSYRSLRARNKDTRCLDIILATKLWERRGVVNLWELTGRDCHRLGQSEQWMDFALEMAVALDVAPESNMTPEQIDADLIGVPRSVFYEEMKRHIDREAKGERVIPNI